MAIADPPEFQVFVAIDLNEELRSAIAWLQEDLPDSDGVYKTEASQAYINLKFIGETAAPDLEDVTNQVLEGIEKMDPEPFTVSFETYGTFPPVEDVIEVVWLEVTEGSEQVRELHDLFELRMTEAGLARSKGDRYRPHVSIAQVDRDDDNAQEQINQFLDEHHPEIGTMTVDHVTLKRVEQTPDGPYHESLRAIDF